MSNDCSKGCDSAAMYCTQCYHTLKRQLVNDCNELNCMIDDERAENAMLIETIEKAIAMLTKSDSSTSNTGETTDD